MSEKFLNPYNFVPLGKPARTESGEEIARGKHASVRHDAWQPDALHGQLRCSLVVETPLVIGGKYDRDDDRQSTPTVQAPYRRRMANGGDELAIPGNSLRGLIGNTLETLSNSALRVLEERHYSVRKKHTKALNMIGFLVRDETESGWSLVPCVITSMKPARNKRSIEKSEKYKAIFRKNNGQPALASEVLPAYVFHNFRGRQGFLDNSGRFCNSGDEVYARLSSINDVSIDQVDILADPSKQTGLKVKHGTILGRFTQGDPILPDRYTQLPEDQAKKYQYGALRILGKHNHPDDTGGSQAERDLPPTKKHEYFIPVPLNASEEEDYCRSMEVPKIIIERFKEVWQERRNENSLLPYNLKGLRAEEGLQEHQYVYFDVEKRDGQWTVSEISISAIWRAPVPYSAHKFFARVDSNLLPWSGERSELTPAEALLGVVVGGKNSDRSALPALASRVRFHDAAPREAGTAAGDDSILMEEVKLQILGAPKLPSSKFYFRFPKKPDSPVKKENLLEPNTPAIPRGRKWYLHHPLVSGEAPWASRTARDDKGNKQRICARPVRVGSVFDFTVGFSNLTPEELVLLCAAIRPSEKYRHKLGLGKPLGLGTVQLRIDSITLEERSYKTYCPSSLSQDQKVLADFQSRAELLKWIQAQYGEISSLIDPETQGIVETLGDPAKVKFPVCYPRTDQQFGQWSSGPDGHESELFQWFVNDDQGPHPQALRAVSVDDALPPLDTNTKRG